MDEAQGSAINRRGLSSEISIDFIVIFEDLSSANTGVSVLSQTPAAISANLAAADLSCVSHCSGNILLPATACQSYSGRAMSRSIVQVVAAVLAVISRTGHTDAQIQVRNRWPLGRSRHLHGAFLRVVFAGLARHE